MRLYGRHAPFARAQDLGSASRAAFGGIAAESKNILSAMADARRGSIVRDSGRLFTSG